MVLFAFLLFLGVSGHAADSSDPKSCMDCHNRGGRLSPRPVQLNQESDFRAVGYKDSALIERLMSYH